MTERATGRKRLHKNHKKKANEREKNKHVVVLSFCLVFVYIRFNTGSLSAAAHCCHRRSQVDQVGKKRLGFFLSLSFHRRPTRKKNCLTRASRSVRPGLSTAEDHVLFRVSLIAAGSVLRTIPFVLKCFVIPGVDLKGQIKRREEKKTIVKTRHDGFQLD